MKTTNNKHGFEDKCVIYYSTKDACWVAHSLHTDQIGTGHSFLEAFTDLLMGMSNLIRLASKNKSIEVRREAPRDIQRRAERAKPLPHELYEVAYKIARGDWPKDIRLTAEPTRRSSLATDISTHDLLLKRTN